MTKIKCNVHLLSTDTNQADLYLSNHSKTLRSNFTKIDKSSNYTEVTYKHIYITENREPEIGEWIYDNEDKEINFVKDIEYLEAILRLKDNRCKPIIITTDESLKIDELKLHDFQFSSLPKPSKEWIKQYISTYNSGKPITECEVEVDCNHSLMPNKVIDIVKTNPQNEAIISTIKDSWTREEVIEFGLKCVKLGMDLQNNPLPRLNEKSGKQFYYNWIEQNL